MVAFPYAGGIEETVEFFHGDGHLAERVTFATDIIERRLVPVLAGSVLKTLEIMDVRIICHVRRF